MKKDKMMSKFELKILKYVGIVGVIWGVLFPTIVYFYNKSGGEGESLIMTLYTGYLFIFGGIYLLVKYRGKTEIIKLTKMH